MFFGAVYISYSPAKGWAGGTPPPRSRTTTRKGHFAVRDTGPKRLLDLDLRAHVLELLLDGGRLVLRDALLHDFRRAVDEVLRLLEAEARDLANDLDDVDLLVAGIGEVNRELGLLLGRGGRRAGRRSARRRHHHRSRGRRRDAPLLLQRLDELGHLHDR